MGFEKTAQRLRGCFYLLFAVLIGNLLVQTVFFDPWFGFKPLPSLLAAAVWLAAFAGLAVLLRRAEGWLCAHRIAAVALALAVTAATQLIFYGFAACWPVRDLQYIHDAAYEYTIAGQITGISQDYLYKFPNNLPVVALLQLVWRVVYRVMGAGFEGFSLLGVLLNAGAILLAYLFTFLAAEQLLGTRRAFWCWGVLYLCLPLQFLVTYYYTDTLTLCFAPMAVYAWLRMQKPRRFGVQAAMAAGFGLCIGAGISLKVTIVIVLVAIAIDGVLRRAWKPLALLLACTALGVCLCNAAVERFAYGGRVLDQTIAADEATPYTNWIAMGMMGDGSYTPDTNLDVWQYEGKQARQQRSLEILRQRYEAFGGFGNYLLYLNQKGIRSFGNGDLETPNTVGLHLRKELGLAEALVYENGKWHTAYEYICQGWHLAVFGLMLAAVVQALRGKAVQGFVPLLATFGLYLFLLIWESSQRYLTNFLCIFVLGAAAGMAAVAEERHGRRI
ncbi:MAG: hypothetical protein IJ347_05730 [Faecalibacterium sp.]|nr:hypothetical protein [Faecalibacterium sp.]